MPQVALLRADSHGGDRTRFTGSKSLKQTFDKQLSLQDTHLHTTPPYVKQKGTIFVIKNRATLILKKSNIFI